MPFDTDRRQEAWRDRQEPQPEHRRSAFDGLKLSSGAAVEGPARGPGPAETARELARPAEVRRRSMFDGLRLPAPTPPVARPETIRAEQDRSIQRQADRLRPLSGFEQAVDRYARAYHAIERQMRDGLPVLEGQRQELHQAGLVLDQARPGAAALVVSAARHDQETARALTDLSGRERVGQLVAGMDRERAALADPNVRADRLIDRWQELHKERQALPGWRHEEARSKVEGPMRQIAGAIERDPQGLAVVGERLKAIEASPILQNGPEHYARVLERGGESLVRTAAQQLERQAADLEHAGNRLAAYTNSAYDRRSQDVWMWMVCGFGLVLGIFRGGPGKPDQCLEWIAC
ncbi:MULTISPECIES: DUF6118 family protein [unclassified Aureimonas]|uniref:DUF6118 family protein n=1 Tax=unclassified Aureimonas TaxID=2615206 RepID=UPI00070066BF|nr:MULTISPECIES: DUF6118 family protein [unclassified Aureimonas]KQT59810.1 hypothetical protein ASG62_24290 [Aureimonas sp. Leaf427]KQT60205.1 hypothetical protein ASG54_05520 [Aureimonas sp. Leaf460]